MCVDGVKERGASDAICSTRPHKASRIDGPRIATDHVISSTTWIVRIVDAVLSLIENVKGFSPELHLTELGHFEMLEQGNIKVHSARIVQKVTPSITKRKSAWSNKLPGIREEWAETLGIVK